MSVYDLLKYIGIHRDNLHESIISNRNLNKIEIERQNEMIDLLKKIFINKTKKPNFSRGGIEMYLVDEIFSKESKPIFDTYYKHYGNINDDIPDVRFLLKKDTELRWYLDKELLGKIVENPDGSKQLVKNE